MTMWRAYLFLVIMMEKLLLMEVTKREMGTAMDSILLPNYKISGVWGGKEKTSLDK